MIKLSHVYKTYPGPVHALRDFNLEIEKGDFVFLTGPSGSGKTTLFRMISAFDRPTSGAVQVAGKEINTLSSAQIPYLRRRIGVVFQDFKLLKDRTVFENVALPLRLLSEREAQIRNRVHDVLEQVGLKYKDDQYPEQMSGGEQQRVAIARALIHRPGILIADEPTGNLDPDLSAEIMKLFEKVNAQGTTLFIATHDVEMVESSKHRNVKLRGGRVVEGGNA